MCQLTKELHQCKKHHIKRYIVTRNWGKNQNPPRIAHPSFPGTEGACYPSQKNVQVAMRPVFSGDLSPIQRMLKEARRSNDLEGLAQDEGHDKMSTDKDEAHGMATPGNLTPGRSTWPNALPPLPPLAQAPPAIAMPTSRNIRGPGGSNAPPPIAPSSSYAQTPLAIVTPACPDIRGPPAPGQRLSVVQQALLSYSNLSIPKPRPVKTSALPFEKKAGKSGASVLGRKK
ncbi:hypothetical protein CC80DRAFT_502373 [Byssothecium circinans]|uniref:Uncharacterized protein n=1 Tax=Byssothecium circinans TaxID=147558 RepID=A0A6A5U4U2_9PLEO|nr:hypothetical protein CC80DRAFT_502373 [Byssothecium circinans]